MIKLIQKTTGYKAVIKGSFSVDLSKTPSLSATDILFEPGPNGVLPPIRSIGQIGITLDMPFASHRLINILELTAEDVFFRWDGTTNQNHKNHSKKSAHPLRHFKIPVIEKLRLSNIHFAYSTDNNESVTNIELRNLLLNQIGDSRTITIEAEGSVNNLDFEGNGQIGSAQDALNIDKPYPVQLALKIADLAFALNGTVADPIKGKGLDIRINAEGSQLDDLLRELQIEFPSLGIFNLHARIAGNLSAPELSSLDAKIYKDPNNELFVVGSMADILTFRETKLEIRGTCNDAEIIKVILPKKVSDRWQVLKGRTEVRHDGSGFILERIAAEASGKKGERFHGSGSMKFGNLNKLAEIIQDMDIDFELSSPTTRGLDSIALTFFPEFGSFTLRGRLEGTSKTLRFERLTMTTSANNGLKTKLTGAVHLFPLSKERPLADIRIDANLNAPEMKATDLLFKKQLVPRLGPVRGSAMVVGNSQVLAVQEISVEIGTPETGRLLWGGRVGSIPLGNDNISDINLQGSVQAEEAATFLSYLGIDLEKMGPLSGRFLLTGKEKTITLEKLHLELGKPETYQLTADGRAPVFKLGNSILEDKIDLVCVLKATNLEALGDIFGIDLPATEAMTGNFEVAGSLEHLEVKRAILKTISPEGINIKAQGGIRDISVNTTPKFHGIDFQLSATAPGIFSFPALVDLSVPELGSIAIQGRIKGDGNELRIENLTVRTDRDNHATLEAAGNMLIFPHDQRYFLEASLDSFTGAWLAGIFTESAFPGVPIEGQVKISGKGKELIIEDIFLKSKTPEKFNANINGIVEADRKNFSGNGRFSISSEESGQITAILGLKESKLSAMNTTGDITIKHSKLSTVFKTQIGKSSFRAKMNQNLEELHPAIDIEIDGSVFRLDDFGIESKSSKIPEVNPKTIPPAGEKQWVFKPEPYKLDILKNLEGTVHMDIDTFEGYGFLFQDFDARLTMNKGALNLDVPNTSFGDGMLSFQGKFDAGIPEPAIAFELTGTDIDMATVHEYVPRKLIPEGKLNIFTNVKSKGRSAREMASSLNGEYSVTVKAGKIKSVADYITTDAFDMITGLPFISNYQDLNCFALRIEFNDGIGMVSSALDTDKVKTTGLGSIDFINETIDIVLKPKPKNQIIGYGSPLWIKGPLNRPVMKKIPFMEAARLSGDILMPHVFLSARALGFLWNLLRNNLDTSTPCPLLVDPKE